ncbi:MAG: CHASE3 domain-containing protein, partial [Lutibacter sp.]
MPARLLKKTWLIKSIFFTSAFIVLLVGGITYRNIDDLSQSSELLTQTYKVNVQLEQILSYLKDAETEQLGFIITHEPVVLEHFNTARENINNSFAKLKELTKDDTPQQQNLKDLYVLIDKRMESFQKYVTLSSVDNYNNPNFKENFLNEKNLMNSIRAKIKEMIHYENGLLSHREATYESYLKLTPISLYLVLLFSLVLMFAAYNKIISDFRELKKNNVQLEIFKESTNQSEIISGHGNWIWNIEEDTFLYSDNLYRLFGEKPYSFEPTLKNYLSFVHPEDIGKLKKELENIIKDEGLPFIYYRIIRKNGDIKHFKTCGKMYINSEGK